MRKPFNQAILTFAVMVVLFVSTGQVSFAEIIVIGSYADADVTSNTDDVVFQNNELQAINYGLSGPNSSSTSAPTYSYGDLSTLGTAAEAITNSPGTLTVSSSETLNPGFVPDNIDAIQTATGFGYAVFTVIQTTGFTLTDTLTSTAGFNIVQLGEYSPTSLSLVDVETAVPGTYTFTGTLYAGADYVLRASSQGHLGPIYSSYGYTGNATATAVLTTSVQATSVPEPSSIALMGLGGIGLAIDAYRRRRMAAV